MLLAFNSLVFTPPWEGGIHSILIRDPVPRMHWIAGRARNDIGRGRNDNGSFRDNNGISATHISLS